MLSFLLLIGEDVHVTIADFRWFFFHWPWISPRRESLAEQVSKLRRSCAVKEAEVAKAKDDERPFGHEGMMGWDG